MGPQTSPPPPPPTPDPDVVAAAATAALALPRARLPRLSLALLGGPPALASVLATLQAAYAAAVAASAGSGAVAAAAPVEATAPVVAVDPFALFDGPPDNGSGAGAAVGVTAESLLASLPTLPPSHEADVTAAAAVVAATLGAVGALRAGDDLAAVRLADAAAILGGPDAVAALRPLVAAAEASGREEAVEHWRVGAPVDLSDDPNRLEAVAEIPAADVAAATAAVGGRPFVVRAGVAAWPAVAKWTPAYLRVTVGHRTVPVEVGEGGGKATAHPGKGSGGVTERLALFSEVLDGMVEPPPAATRGGVSRITDAAAIAADVGASAAVPPPLYMAQHPLLEQLTDLATDVYPPPWVPTGRPLVGVHAWVGPPRTHTRLHSDSADNALAQVAGVKVVRLVDPVHTSHLAVPSDGRRNVAGVDDLVHPTGVDSTTVAAVPYGRVVLRAGDVLHIPAGWWHDVRSVGAAVSVNYWF
ncbi:hypothetical protein MMPV_005028 [Pyropia vietnamensis]